MATADFNGDGTIDLAVVNEADNTVSILLGKPDGTYAPQVAYATDVGPLAIVSGDFDGDGNLDLAVTNGDCIPAIGGSCAGHTVSIFLGNGDGTFQPHFDYATGTQPSAVAAGDFNGDGKLDLAVVNTVDGTVSVLLGNGDGTFRAQVVYPTASLPQSVIVGDFNGDHVLDLAVGGSDCSYAYQCVPETTPPADGVSVLLGNGDGTFQAKLDSPGASPLAAADFNLDGKLDLFAGGNVLLGNGNGTFVLHATYPSGTAAAVADLNGDGKPDLVLAQGGDNNASADSVAVLLGNGDGTFQTAAQYGTAAYPAGVVIADFNGDGKFDLAVVDPNCIFFACSTPGAISILLGFGDGTFVGGTDYAFSSSTPPARVISADFNGDGKPDIAASAGSALGVFLGNGDGTFPAEVSTTLTNSVFGGLAAGDFNGDGKADLATVISNCPSSTCLPGDAVVFIGTGDGSFHAPVQYTVGLQPEYVAVGDFDGNGKPDLAVSNFGSSTVSILLNSGTGTFASHVDYPVGANPGSIVAENFRGGAILDLAVVAGQGVSILLGNGSGIFAAGTSLTVSALPSSVAAADFDGDGKLDLAVTTQTSDQVFIFLGNGDGTFQPPVSYPDGLDFALPSVGDFNGDGKPDLILGSNDAYIGSILLGNGDGSFQQPIFNFLSGSLIAVADFNQDGSPDVAAGTGAGGAPPAVTVMLSAAFGAVSPASLNFGSQGVGTTSAAQTITISNPSNVSFDIASLAASANFSQTNTCGASLAPGASCAASVAFTPAAAALETGSITVTDGAKVSPLVIPLSGTGVSGPFLALDPTQVNFVPQTIGTSSTAAAIMLVNTGNTSLSITGIAITGAESSDFAQTNNCGSSLAAAGSCTVNVKFAPTAGGSRTARIAVSDTAPGSPQSANLAGSGIGPAASLTANALSFSAQATGTTSAAQMVTLTNIGDQALTFTRIAASGDFGETNTCNASLAAGSSCEISVTFTPTGISNRAGSVTFADNAAGSPQTVALSGAGVAAPNFSVGAASGSSTSQTISAGQSAKFSLVVTPTGSFTGTVNLSCSVSPMMSPAPTCGLSIASVQISGSAAQPITVTVGTTAAATTGTVPQVHFPPGAMPITWTLALLGIAALWLRDRKRLPWLAAPLLALAAVMCAGCGGSGGSSQATSGTPAGTYTATMTATSGSLSHTTTVTVVVE